MPKDSKQIMNKYFHIDNGGYSFKINATSNGEEYLFDGLEIEYDFYGYCGTKINLNRMTVKDLKELGVALISASEQLSNINKKDLTS
jgi:hypothetical protein